MTDHEIQTGTTYCKPYGDKTVRVLFQWLFHSGKVVAYWKWKETNFKWTKLQPTAGLFVKVRSQYNFLL